MNLDRLYKILGECTMQLRKGEEIEGTPELVEQIKRGEEPTVGGMAEIYAMPHVSEARPDIEKVDVEFVVIGVDKAKAEEYRAEFISILKQWPNPERLAAGPSYIEVGGEIGDQGAAFQMFALGKVLKLWDVITPKMLGATGEQARQMAGMGYVMMSGFDMAKPA
jgi:hypothetical protein